MQQVLGEKADVMDPMFQRQLILQHLPSNVRMILTTTTKGNNLQELTEMVDSVMEVDEALMRIGKCNVFNLIQDSNMHREDNAIQCFHDNASTTL